MDLTNQKIPNVTYYSISVHNDDIFYWYITSHKITATASHATATVSAMYKLNIDGIQNNLFYEKVLRGLKITSMGNFIAIAIARVAEYDKSIVYLDQNGNLISEFKLVTNG